MSWDKCPKDREDRPMHAVMWNTYSAHVSNILAKCKMCTAFVGYRGSCRYRDFIGHFS